MWFKVDLSYIVSWNNSPHTQNLVMQALSNLTTKHQWQTRKLVFFQVKGIFLKVCSCRLPCVIHMVFSCPSKSCCLDNAELVAVEPLVWRKRLDSIFQGGCAENIRLRVSVKPCKTDLTILNLQHPTSQLLEKFSSGNISLCPYFTCYLVLVDHSH